MGQSFSVRPWASVAWAEWGDFALLSPTEQEGGAEGGRPMIQGLWPHLVNQPNQNSPTEAHAGATNTQRLLLVLSESLPPSPVWACSPVLWRRHSSGGGHNSFYLCSWTAGPSRWERPQTLLRGSYSCVWEGTFWWSLDGRVDLESLQSPISALRTLWMALSCLDIREVCQAQSPGAMAGHRHTL